MWPAPRRPRLGGMRRAGGMAGRGAGLGQRHVPLPRLINCVHHRCSLQLCACSPDCIRARWRAALRRGCCLRCAAGVHLRHQGVHTRLESFKSLHLVLCALVDEHVHVPHELLLPCGGRWGNVSTPACRSTPRWATHLLPQQQAETLLLLAPQQPRFLCCVPSEHARWPLLSEGAASRGQLSLAARSASCRGAGQPGPPPCSPASPCSCRAASAVAPPSPR